MSEDKFKLPRSSYEELSKIIRAYGRTSKPSSLAELTKLTGIGRTHVSSNNAFLLGVNIIEGGNSKSPTSKGSTLALALEHEMPEEITKAWRKIVEEDDFLNKMVQAVGVRKGMEVTHLENHIAYSAGEAKSKDVMTGARAVIDILRSSGLVRQEGDQIIPNSLIVKRVEETNIDNETLSTNNQVTQIIQPSIPIKLDSNTRSATLHIEIRINVNPSEIDGLGEKIKELLRSLS